MESWFDHVMLSRYQFGFTTLFHINWAAISIGLSIFLVAMEGAWLVTKEKIYYHHSRFWGKIILLNFAVGAMTGLPLEFQFGTNWGPFSAATHGFFGNILGFEASIAFMLEAGFLGIMLFGWNRVPWGVHFFSTCMVALGASASAFWIMVANSWMQTPTGGYWDGTRFITTNWLESLFNPDMGWGTSHMWVAALEASLFLIGGISAWYILRNRFPEFYRKSFLLAVLIAILVTPIQIWLGDGSGGSVAETQPAKLAGIEAHWETNPPGTGAAWHAFAWPNPAKKDNDWTFITIPHFLSMLSFHQYNHQVKGLRDFPPDEWPPIAPIFYSFRVMAAIGFGLFFLMTWTIWHWARGGLRPEIIGRQKWLLVAWTLASPAGFVAIWCGWITREVGRQPWIIYGMLRTRDGASNLPAVTVASSLLVFGLIYVVLLPILLYFWWRIFKKGPDLEQEPPKNGKGLGIAS